MFSDSFQYYYYYYYYYSNSTIIPNTDTDPIIAPPIRVPSWVKFRQCWLSVVQGTHPCNVDEAITVRTTCCSSNYNNYTISFIVTASCYIVSVLCARQDGGQFSDQFLQVTIY